MLGFESETTENEIQLLDQELEAAAWFGADEIETKLKQGLFKMPTAISISWKLIDRWFSQQKGYSVKSLEQ